MFTSAIKKQTSVCCSISLNLYMVWYLESWRKKKKAYIADVSCLTNRFFYMQTLSLKKFFIRRKYLKDLVFRTLWTSFVRYEWMSEGLIFILFYQCFINVFFRTWKIQKQKIVSDFKCFLMMIYWLSTFVQFLLERSQIFSDLWYLCPGDTKCSFGVSVCACCVKRTMR